MKDQIGDRIKMYENIECARRFIPLLPIYIRLDGKCFSSFTRNMNRPYDKRLSELMRETTKYLVKESGAVIGYTQSDEISLILYSDSIVNQVYFDGKIQKLVSILASQCTAYFNSHLGDYFSDMNKMAIFDCRCFQLPSLMEAVNVLVWRELDATRNSLSMATRHYYSHKEMMNKKSSEMHNMLMYKMVNWNDYPTFFKRGTYIKKEELNIPPLSKISNKVEVIFYDEEPILKGE